MNSVIKEDIETIIADSNIQWNEIKNSTVLVTGATGLVGSLIVKMFAYFNTEYHGNVNVIAMIRSKEKADKVLGTDIQQQGVSFIYGDINKPVMVDDEIDFIIHGASITESKVMVTKPVETLFTAIEGTKNMLELARHKAVKSMVYISSMEMYGITDPEKKVITEKDLGYIDNLSVRSSYSEGKRCCELICSSYCSEYGIPVKIARLAQTFGAGVLKTDHRVFAQFANSAMNETNIILHTKGNSFGNYCYTADVIRGILCILTKGENGEAYTVVNEETTMQIKSMAKLVAEKIAEGKIEVSFDVPNDLARFGYAPDVTMHLSSKKIRKLGWKPEYNLEEMYRRMISSWEI